MKHDIASMMTELRGMGCKIKVSHYRFVYQDDSEALANLSVRAWKQSPLLKQYRLSPNGGRVDVDVTMPDGTRVATRSKCSMMDNFNRKIGTTIALGRAFKLVKQIQKQKI